jgi:hypothetical protein
MTLPEVRNWRIHVGAHKTATTHLQDTLARHRADLRKGGVDYIARDQFRSIQLPYHGKFGWRIGYRYLVRPRALQRLVDPFRTGNPTVLVSEENLLGWVGDALRTPPYPTGLPRIMHLVSLLGRTPFQLFLSVRGFHELIPSAYVQAVRQTPVPGGFEAVRRSVLRRPPRWRPFVDWIQRLVGRDRLRIWTFETYRDQEAAIFGRLSGVDLTPGRSLSIPPTTRRLSREAVASLERLDPRLPRRERQERVEEIVANDEGRDRFDPLTRSEHAWLAELYDRDLRELRTRHPHLLIEP